MIDFKKLVDAGVHFGHLTSGWFPKMKEYIWGVKNKVHLIDVSKTAHQLEKAAKFLEQTAAQGKQILWVGTKKAAQDAVKEYALSLNQPFVNHRWVGGTLSNFGQVKKSVTKLLHLEDVLAKAEKYPHYTKQEFNEIQKQIERLEISVGGIRKLFWPIGAVVLVDVNKEKSALKEAVKMGIPVVGIVDTNSDPSLVDFVIPANDDSTRSIRVLIEYLAQAAQRGVQISKEHGKQVSVSEVFSSEVLDVIPGADTLEEETEETAGAGGDSRTSKKKRPVVRAKASPARNE